jgi:hypothetical protein
MIGRDQMIRGVRTATRTATQELEMSISTLKTHWN